VYLELEYFQTFQMELIKNGKQKHLFCSVPLQSDGERFGFVDFFILFCGLVGIEKDSTCLFSTNKTFLITLAWDM